MRNLFVAIVKGYQAFLSPLLPFNHCRFYPSCSQYAVEAVEKYGVRKGVTLACQRVLQCHPFSKKHGYDPVP